MPPEDTQAVVEEALEAGYRHIDTAAAYRNEKGVGEAIAASGIAREEVFVTTKLWNSEQGYDSTLAAFEKSLERLGLDHVDLYLIHWPVPTEDRFVDTWRAFERIHEEGGARTIGVSNFRVEDLERLEAEAETRPTVNQIELHPQPPAGRAARLARRARHRHRGLEPARPGRGCSTTRRSPRSPPHHGKTPAQAILRWHLQLGNVVIPKSVTPERIRENIDVFDFELTEDEMAAIERLDSGERIGPDPATFVAP